MPLASVPERASELRQRRRDGSWYGFSVHLVRDAPGSPSRTTEVVVAHLENPGTKHVYRSPRDGWDFVRLNSIDVQAWKGGKVAGKAYFTRYGVADGHDMTHPTVWSSSKTDVEADWRRRGVAQAIYGHLKHFGYPVTPAPVLLWEGQVLWTAGLDPDIAMVGAGSFSRGRPVRNPPLPPPPHRDTLDPEGFVGRFDTEKTLGARFFGESRDVVSKLVGEPFVEFRSRLGEVFEDPDGAFATLLMSHVDDEATVAELLSKPKAYGNVKPVGLFGWLARRRKKALAPVTEMLPEVLAAWRRLKRKDDERLRCRFGDDCHKWLGHGTPPFGGD
jgi:hypothetical protein